MHASPPTLLIVSVRGEGHPVVRAVLERWRDAQQHEAVHARPVQLVDDPHTLDGARAAWVLQESAGDTDAQTALDLLSDRRVPALLTRPDEPLAPGQAVYDGVVAAPLSAGADTLLAMLGALWTGSALFDDLQVEVGFLRAHQTGLCDQIDRIDEELRLAAQLQREFLPSQLPRVGAVEFDVLFRPAGYVSGDIYDVVRLDEHHVGFFIADAVGHGVPAALMTMFIKRALHTREINPTLPSGYRLIPPQEAMARLNADLIAQQNGHVRTATACYGVLDCRTLELSFARAGHPFPIILRADGGTESLKPDGGLLGVFPDETYETATTRLRPGDRVLLYSDGFEVAFPDLESEDGRIANDQYEQEFQALATGRLDEAIARLDERLNLQAGSLNQRDDLTVVCMHVKTAQEMAERPEDVRQATGGAKHF